MLFQTFTFLLVFLPVAFLGYELLSRFKCTRLLLVWLIVCSLIFYGWGERQFVLLLISSIAFNYLVSLLLNWAQSGRKWILTAGVACNLAILGYYKYVGFFANTVNQLTGTQMGFQDVILPLAISFFTFQQIVFLVRTYRLQLPKVSFLHYAAYIAFFPQLIAGPIVQPQNFLPQIRVLPVAEKLSRRLSIGITYFALGLFKKVVIADGIEMYSFEVFDLASNGATIPFFLAWCGALAFTFQIYFDFSAYSDMAIGLARLFGLRLPVNFNAPYRSFSITEFWRRWHITLTDFLRDYVYIPLGGNRKGYMNTLRNIMLTMLLSGLWHGAGWTFIAWGAIHGIAMCIHRIWTKWMGSPFSSFRLWLPFSWFLTFGTVVISWVLFRASSFASAFAILKGMFGINGFKIPPAFSHVKTQYFAGWWNIDGKIQVFTLNQWLDNRIYLWLVALILFVLLLPSVYEFMHTTDDTHEPAQTAFPPLLGRIFQWKPTVLYGIGTGALIAVSVYTMFISSPEPFIYFRF